MPATLLAAAGAGLRAGGRMLTRRALSRRLPIVYVPRHFGMTDGDEIAALVDAAGTADLVTFDGARPVASLIPVIWDRDPSPRSPHGRLLGHLALANPQWQSAGATALAIVRGPQAYISPSWYPSTAARRGRAVPTWNYIAVHLTGPLVVHRDEQWLRDVVARLTDRHERGRPGRWSVAGAPEDYISGMLRAIVGVEVLVHSVEAAGKLSQNRDARDRAGAVAGLRGEPGPGAAAVADLMARLPRR